MRPMAPMLIVLELALLTATQSPLTTTSHSPAAANLFPSLSGSGSVISITSPSMITQIELDKPNLVIFSPQDQQQEFRLRIALQQLLEVAPANQTEPIQVLDTVDLQTLAWGFSQERNDSDTGYGRYLQLRLSASGNLQRGPNVSRMDMSLTIFASERQNETAIIADDWAALESVGGPTQVKLDISIHGWPFRSSQSMLVLRVSVDGSQGTVRHHGEFSATELFNTVGIVNDVTRRQDAYVQWLRRAVVDNGTSRRSADVTLKTFADGEATGVDLYYPSFTNSTLKHDPIIGTSDTFFSAPFVPIQFGNLLAGGASLLVLVLSIIFLTHRSYLTLHRNR